MVSITTVQCSSRPCAGGRTRQSLSACREIKDIHFQREKAQCKKECRLLDSIGFYPDLVTLRKRPVTSQPGFTAELCYKQSYTARLTNAALHASHQLVFTSTTNIWTWTVELGLNRFTQEWPNGFITKCLTAFSAVSDRPVGDPVTIHLIPETI